MRRWITGSVSWIVAESLLHSWEADHWSGAVCSAAKLLDLVRQFNEPLPPLAERTVRVTSIGGAISRFEFVRNTRALGGVFAPATTNIAEDAALSPEIDILPLRQSQPWIEPSGAAACVFDAAAC